MKGFVFFACLLSSKPKRYIPRNTTCTETEYSLFVKILFTVLITLLKENPLKEDCISVMTQRCSFRKFGSCVVVKAIP